MSKPLRQGRAFLAVGSNVMPLKNIPAALRECRQRLTVQASSTFYETAPLGPPGQPTFVNGVWQVKLPGRPDSLKEICRVIEQALGRRRTADRYAPRPIDLDVVYRDDQPDRLPDDLPRAFVCVPLLEIAPDLNSTPVGPWARNADQPGKPEPDLTRQLRNMLNE